MVREGQMRHLQYIHSHNRLHTHAVKKPTFPESEYNALKFLYNTTNGENWRWLNTSGGWIYDNHTHGIPYHVVNLTANSIPWNFTRYDVNNPCTDNWQGVVCSCTATTCHVTQLDLDQHNITGTLPAQFFSLNELLFLSFRKNNITGSLPSSMSTSQKLIAINLEANAFTGILDDWWSELTDLLYLGISRNAFTNFSSGFFDLPRLQFLDMAFNDFKGSFPADFGNYFPNMRELLIGGNRFTGTIPLSFANFTQFRGFDAEINDFAGPFPSVLCLLINITGLSLGTNRFTGTIPECITNLTLLTRVLLSRNDFFGSLPQNLDNCPDLIFFNLDGNLFSGSLPHSLSKLRKLRTLRESLRQINVVSGLQTRPDALELISKSRDEEARVQLGREENGSTDVFFANPMRSTSPLHPTVTPHSAHPIDLPDAPSKPRRPDVSISAMTNSTNIFNHFRMIRRELVSRVKFELSRLHPLLARCFSFNFQNIRMQQKQERFLRYRVRMKKLSYHEILNIALKFLVDINHVNMQSINFDRPTYRLILLFICIVFPIYVFFSRTLVWYIIAPISQCPNGLLTSDSAEVCRYYFYFLLLTLGSMTLYFVQLIFGMSIMVALVSLSYGSEIAYRLTDAWIKKFKSLRRVEEYDMEEFIDQNLEKKKNASIGRNHSGRSVKAAVVTSDEVMPFVSKRQFHFESEKNICEHPLYYWIKRDATEHYFFICEVFQASDRIWSPALTFIFLMAVGIALVAVLSAVLLGNISHPIVLLQTIIFASVRIFVLFIYPLMSLCHANAYIYELTNCFKRASKDDFQLIGGCEQWIDFMENCPAAWTYNGIWITWDRLLGLVWTFAAAAVASGLGTLLSFVSS